MKALIALVFMAVAVIGCQSPAAPADPDMIERQRAELQEAAGGILADGADAAFDGGLTPPNMAAMPTPAPTVAPTPTPAPTRPAFDTGICYRTPEMQRWIIQKLQIPSCRLITEPELYRIEEGLNGIFKPGDLSGLANVPSVGIYGYCGDWTDADHAAAVLQGFNPNASISVEADIPYHAEANQQGWYLQSAYGSFGAGNPDRSEIDRRGAEGGLNADQMAGLYRIATGLKQRVNQRARDIAEAVSTARDGKPGMVRLKTTGQAVVGDLSKPGYISVSVNVRWQPGNDMPECKE